MDPEESMHFVKTKARMTMIRRLCIVDITSIYILVGRARIQVESAHRLTIHINLDFPFVSIFNGIAHC